MAFTLIELLVVIAIIAMFNAIGYPTTNGGLDEVRSTSVLFPAQTVLFADNVVVYPPARPAGTGQNLPAMCS